MAEQKVRKFIPKETKRIKYFSTKKGEVITNHFAKIKFNIKLEKKDERSLDRVATMFAKYLLKKQRTVEKKEYNTDINGTTYIYCNLFLNDLYDLLLNDYGVKVTSYHVDFTNPANEYVVSETVHDIDDAVLELMFERLEC